MYERKRIPQWLKRKAEKLPKDKQAPFLDTRDAQKVQRLFEQKDRKGNPKHSLKLIATKCGVGTNTVKYWCDSRYHKWMNDYNNRR